MKFLRCALLLMLVVGPVLAGGQDTRQAELTKADQKLNEVYQKILHRLAEPEQVKLKKSQRAWMAFRDLDCKWAFDAVPLDCMIDRTENRVRELEQTVFSDKAGAYQRAKDKPKP
jgi:uncharacterized protein YecT (DUF1311 family)